MPKSRPDPLLHNNQFRLRQLIRSRRPAWLIALVLGLLTLIATVGLLALSGWFISAAALAGLTGLASVYTFNYFMPAAAIRLLAITRTAGRYGERLAAHHAVLSLLSDLRSTLFARLLNTPATRLHFYSTQQMHRLTSDVETLNEWPLAVLLPWCWAALLVIIYLGFSAWFSLTLSVWLALPLMLALIAIPYLASRANMNATRDLAQKNEQRRSALLAPLSALTALLQWGRWDDYAQQFTQQDHIYHSNQLLSTITIRYYTLMQQLCIIAAIALLLCQGTLLLNQGSLTVAVLLALLLGLLGLSEALLPLVSKSDAIGKSVAARDRLNPLLSASETIEHTSKLPLPHNPWRLELINITARQPQAFTGPEQINLSLRSGDTLIIEGPSGGGKSTLLDVLAGELLPLSGQIILNGQPYDDFNWRGHIGYLAQRWMIFDLTLAENLRLGTPHASDEDLWCVLDQVFLAEWAQQQPQGLNTPLGEYGAAVSGGQARRIALARLLLRPYPLLLLDEPLVGLDPHMRQALFTRLRTHQKNGILIIVSHHHLNIANDDAQLSRLTLGNNLAVSKEDFASIP